MKRAVTVLAVLSFLPLAAEEKPAPPAPAFDAEKALAALRERIAGKEEEPAEKVFENIKILKGVPAGRLLKIMEMGWSRSLGVTCTHCHDPEMWADDSKEEKKIARGMAELTARLDSELLPAIPGLEERKPVVNCTTCHRGEKKPALQMK